MLHLRAIGTETDYQQIATVPHRQISGPFRMDIVSAGLSLNQLPRRFANEPKLMTVSSKLLGKSNAK